MTQLINGIVLLDKPLGLSSNAALQRVKHLFGAAKAGHSGSLDPLASGMLPICLGEATKIAGHLLDSRKCYAFTLLLGARTATGDSEGEVVERLPVPEIDEVKVRAVLASFLGPQMQVPPMYSALNYQGQRLYALARKGIEVERPPRPIEILEIDFEAFHSSAVTVRVVCSKGTYVRVLAEDIAKALGTCGHVTALRRLWSAPFTDEPMVSLDTLTAQKEQGASLDRYILPLERALAGWQRVDLDNSQADRLLHGQRLRLPAGTPAAAVCIYGPDGRFLGIGEVDPAGLLKPQRLISTNTP